MPTPLCGGRSEPCPPSFSCSPSARNMKSQSFVIRALQGFSLIWRHQAEKLNTLRKDAVLRDSRLRELWASRPWVPPWPRAPAASTGLRLQATPKPTVER